ncbi:MAG: quinone-dependent dihydroorotate dehydrogenase [Pseudomonadota bacterium]
MALNDLGLSAVRRLPPEAAHIATIRALKAGLGVSRADPAQWSTAITLPRSGLHLPNPVGLAAGFDKNADVFTPMFQMGFGFVECGTVTPRPQPGNFKPRLFRLEEDRAVINRMGFNNRGLDAFVANLSASPRRPGILGANVGANKTAEDRIADYATGIEAVYAHCDYITINISSPNTPGLRGLQDPEALSALLVRCEAARATAHHTFLSMWGDQSHAPGKRPVLLKLAPDLDETAIDDIVSVLKTDGGWLSGLIISNTTLERPETLKAKDRFEQGGLSGAPLMAASTDVLRAFARRLDGRFDLIGAGGIANGLDAYRKIRAGAHAVQLYTALVYGGPALVETINLELAGALRSDGFETVAAAVGADLR